jgi:peroxiredoxin
VPALRRTSRRVLAGTCALTLAASLGACTTSSGESVGVNGYITGKGVVTTIKPAERKDVPELSGDALGGGSIDVSDYRGQIVVVNVWASWCPPCRAEADDLVAAYEGLPEAAFFGLDTIEDSKSAAEAFVREHEIPYESLYDEDGSLLLAFHGTLRPDSLPSTIVIDTMGRIAALVLGPVTTSTLVGLVEDLEQES